MNKYKVIKQINFGNNRKILVGSEVELIKEYTKEKICILYDGYKIMTSYDYIEKI